MSGSSTGTTSPKRPPSFGGMEVPPSLIYKLTKQIDMNKITVRKSKSGRSLVFEGQVLDQLGLGIRAMDLRMADDLDKALKTISDKKPKGYFIDKETFVWSETGQEVVVL
jgi:hypothetical protein